MQSSPPLPEEAAQQLGPARLVDPAIDLRAVVAGRLLEEARAVLDGAALGIVGAEIEAADARERDRGGAHGAGLERDVEIALLEARPAALRRRVAQHQHLGMRG